MLPLGAKPYDSGKFILLVKIFTITFSGENVAITILYNTIDK
jgi:hypothetical protein